MEKKWQKIWQEKRQAARSQETGSELQAVRPREEKVYCLGQFPYPSG